MAACIEAVPVVGGTAKTVRPLNGIAGALVRKTSSAAALWAETMASATVETATQKFTDRFDLIVAETAVAPMPARAYSLFDKSG